MATSLEEIKKRQGDLPPTRREYFSIADFKTIMAVLPNHCLELLKGELVINKRSPLQYFSIEDFKAVAEALPEHRLELIKGEIVMMPPPDEEHQYLTSSVIELWAAHVQAITALGCRIGGTNCFFEVPEQFRDETGAGPSDVCPDAVIYYRGFHRTNRRPPALLAVEVLSYSNRRNLERDTVTKPEIYAALEIPAYWIVDRRDQSVWVYTEPRADGYQTVAQFTGEQLLPAPGLEFLQLTPAQLFAA